jgi:hypothetical protein
MNGLNLGSACNHSVQSLLSHLLPKSIKTQKITILPVMLNGYENWSLTSRAQHMLWGYEEEKDHILGLSKLHKEELHNLHSS